MCQSMTGLVGLGRGVAVGEEEAGGDEEDGEEDREEQAADDGLSERRV
jgi:hypothetical protein